MPLFNEVRRIIERLAPRGWAPVLADHGVDLAAVNLESELRRPLQRIQRTKAGFEDFSSDGSAAFTPGKPAQSLLYHALASPNVLPRPQAPATAEDFATLAELDTLENYIYSLARPKLSRFSNLVIAVLAYQYRIGSRSPHQRHADMAFSRTGIARIGTAPMNYDPIRRSFWMAPPNGGAGIAVMPARYGVFLAELRKPTKADPIMHRVGKGDANRMFAFPVHKLFPGDECLQGVTIPAFTFVETHRNEKLRKIHEAPHLDPAERLQLLPGFDRNATPLVRTSRDLVRMHPIGATALSVPIHQPTLVSLARQFRSTTGKEEIVAFRVRANNGDNRFTQSSYQIPEDDDAIRAPEYVHIRTRVGDNGLITQNLNNLPDNEFFKTLDGGNYTAAHYVESTGEGAISVDLAALAKVKRLPAYSLLSAPDFLPLVDQLEVQRWADDNRGGTYFNEGAPTPLCDGRDQPPNPEIENPLDASAPAFTKADGTITAVFGPAAHGNSATIRLQASRSTSWMPDAASDVFAPGWDVSQSADQNKFFYAHYGLGSPFAEDAKLCAALNSFWPAAAPDVGRTFGGFTALPHLDDELGLHARHPRVLSGQAASPRGWDGEFGPFFEANGTRINFARVSRSDYTVNALNGTMRPDLLQRIDAIEQIARMEGYRDCVLAARSALGLPKKQKVRNTPLRLITAEKVVDWGAMPGRLDASLVDSGYLFVFARPELEVADINSFESAFDDLTGSKKDLLKPDPQDNARWSMKMRDKIVCQFTRQVLVLKVNNKPKLVRKRPISK